MEIVSVKNLDEEMDSGVASEFLQREEMVSDVVFVILQTE